MIDKEQYAALLSEIIAKQIVILGPDIAVLKARNVSGLTVTDDGKIINIAGDPQQALKELVNQYVELSGLIVKTALDQVFKRYPTIKIIE